MITDVYLVYNDDSVLTKIGEPYTFNKVSPIFHYIDERTLKGKKEALRVKSHWAARATPFAVCYDGEKPVKCFYTEAEDVINSLIQYLNDGN